MPEMRNEAEGSEVPIEVVHPVLIPSDVVHRVLIVDDDEQARRLYGRSLASAGYECGLAATLEEARGLLAKDDFGLAICDLRLQGESGLDLIRQLHADHPEIAVLMASGEDDPMIAQVASDFGVFSYLVKPFSRNQLLIAVEGALYRRRLEQENRRYRSRLESTVEERTTQLRDAVAGLRVAQEETVHRLARAVEMRDAQTGAHIERIGAISGLLADLLGQPMEQVELLRLAASMHDVGKIGIPDRILLKPGELTPEERAEMQRHARIGYNLLAGSKASLLELGATIALTHHERFDGTGYPRRLAGDEIPIEGRIVAVADVFDALVSDRVYRPAFSMDEALEMMRARRGTHFDPTILDLLLDNLQSLPMSGPGGTVASG